MCDPAIDRTTWPEQLPAATRFSDEGPSFQSPLTLISRVKGMPRTMALLDSMLIDHEHGKRRSPGHWGLVLLWFTISHEANIVPFYAASLAQPQMWAACGFREIPSYPTVHARLVELEQFAPVLEEAAAGLIQMARKRNPLIGAWIVVDGTECETHAQPQHDCQPGEACPSQGKKRGPRLKCTSAEEAARLRQEGKAIDPASEAAPDADATTDDADTGKRKRRRKRQPTGDPIPPNGTVEITEDGVRFVSGGHWWLSRDKDAGTRSYGGKKAWHGYMNNKATDLVTRAPLAVWVTPATANEFHLLPALYDRATANSGVEAVAVIADAGLTTNANYDFLTERGVTLVGPTREGSKGKVADGMTVSLDNRCDMHGVPTCRGCGMPCDYVGFSKKSGKARVWFRCPLPSTKKCEKTQSMVCSKAVQRLIPLWRTSSVYSVLRSQVGNLEHVHEDWRSRYRSGGKSLRERPRRVGLAWQQLRANAALLIEWMWVLLRQGWIGPKKAPRAKTVPLSDNGRWASLMERRKRLGLVGGGYACGKAPPGILLPA